MILRVITFPPLNSVLDKDNGRIILKTDNRPLVRFEEGESLSAIWAVRSLGIDPASGQEIFLGYENPNEMYY